MLTAKELIALKGKTIFQHPFNEQTLKVIENSQYRWFTLGGNAVQAIMSKGQPNTCVLPVPQALLIFLLWRNSAKSILNLGLGAGGLERTLMHNHNFDITAVERQPEIINMAKEYFALPDNVKTIADCAESFLAATKNFFDIIICDLYQQEISPEALFTIDFYLNISKKLNAKGCALVSLSVDSQQQLVELLAKLKTLRLNLALIDFTDYKNIILIISKAPLPNKEKLSTTNKQKLNRTNMDFSHYIERMHIIPTLNAFVDPQQSEY